jgi:hypothetical protein
MDWPKQRVKRWPPAADPLPASPMVFRWSRAIFCFSAADLRGVEQLTGSVAVACPRARHGGKGLGNLRRGSARADPCDTSTAASLAAHHRTTRLSFHSYFVLPGRGRSMQRCDRPTAWPSSGTPRSRRSQLRTGSTEQEATSTGVAAELTSPSRLARRSRMPPRKSESQFVSPRRVRPGA